MRMFKRKEGLSEVFALGRRIRAGEVLYGEKWAVLCPSLLEECFEEPIEPISEPAVAPSSEEIVKEPPKRKASKYTKR